MLAATTAGAVASAVRQREVRSMPTDNTTRDYLTDNDIRRITEEGLDEGNTRLVARRHYLQVTEEHFEQAAQNPAQSARCARNAAQYPAASNGNEQNITSQKRPENADLLCGAGDCKSLRDKGMGDTGLEPVTSRV